MLLRIARIKLQTCCQSFVTEHYSQNHPTSKFANDFLFQRLKIIMTRDNGDEQGGIIKENKRQIIFSKCKEVFCIFQLRVNFK